MKYSTSKLYPNRHFLYCVLAVFTHLIWMGGLIWLISLIEMSDAAFMGLFLIVGYGIILIYYAWSKCNYR